MQININIEKKHLWFLVLAVVAVGFVVAYGGTNPPVMGHNFGEIEGVVPTCANPLISGDNVCTGPRNSNWGLGVVAGWAGIAWDSQRLNGRQMRIASQTVSVQGAEARQEFTFSPACPNANYQVFLTAKRMPWSSSDEYGPVFVPVMGTIVDADTFHYTIMDIQVRPYTGNVDVNMLIFCS
ncbi:hypothetical protein J4208_00310 [Candidatus Woesearchaeota archaeon]|nr:hypothetical protein [Candidatus Woesearchaeota archaeon]